LFRDEEDLARDAGVYWKYFCKKHHSPIMENMVEWASVTQVVPEKHKKPKFVHLPQFQSRLAAENFTQALAIEQKFGKIYLGKRERKEAIEGWRKEKRKEVNRLHQKAWNQKEKRDAAIQRIKDGYFRAQNKINKADYVNFFLALKSPTNSSLDPRMFQEEQVRRAKTEREMFQVDAYKCFFLILVFHHLSYKRSSNI